MKLQKILAMTVAMILSVSLFAGCKEDTSEAGATTMATVENTAETTEEPTEAVTEALPVEEPVLNVAVGEIRNVFNPAFAAADGDKEISELIHVPLLTIDRRGEVLYSNTETAASSFQGTDYVYRGIADVSVAYDAATDLTKHTIMIKQGTKFSDGEELTADDVIFTYYVLCDESYDGPSTVKNQGIIGVEAYQKNNSAAPGVTVTAEEISKAISEPTEELKTAIIEQITRPVLQEERAWCEANWEKYVERGYGNSAEEFFVTLYTSTVDADYSIEGKIFDDIVNDTVNLFGMNYKALAKNYQGDLNFFDAQVEQITEDLIYQGKLAEAGGVEVPGIQGIRKVDDYTVEIESKGNDSRKIYSICNIRVLPLHYYGDDSLFDYDANQFGFTRGDLTQVKAKSAEPMGAGPFKYVESEDGAIRLETNENYFAGSSDSFEMKLTYVEDSARLAAVAEGEIDLAQIPYDKAAEEAIMTANGDGSLNGSKILTQLVDMSDYYYFGMNASMMKIGEDANSAQSVALRKAFAVLLAADRAGVAANYYGSSAKVIEYPYSAASWAVPEAGTEGYRTAYSLKADGTSIYTEGQSAEERQAAAKQAAIEYLIQAGYTYSEEDAKFTATPEGGKLEFTALVSPYFAGDTAMTAILNQVKAVLESLGFVLDIQEMENIDEFVIALDSHSVDLWCGERDTSMEPQLYKYYHSEGSSNYYGLNNADMDAQVSASHLTAVYDERVPVYKAIFDIIMNSAVEVPVYQRQDAVVFNAGKIQADSVAVLSEFYDWTDGISSLIIKDPSEAEAETTAAETLTETTTAEETTTVTETSPSSESSLEETSAETASDTTAAESPESESSADAESGETEEINTSEITEE